MNLLHISSDFANQAIYNELVTSLDQLGVERQWVFVPVRSKEELGRNRNPSLRNTEYSFVQVLRPHHRLFFHKKITAIFLSLCGAFDLKKCSIVHSHNLYSNGPVALKIKKQYNIPFITTVRNTDINFFLKFRPDLFSLCKEILLEANCIIFIAPSYPEKLLVRLSPELRRLVRRKIKVVPNGVERIWLDQFPDRRERQINLIRLLYVGEFTRNKNIPNTILAAEILTREFEVNLALVGSGGNGAGKVKKLLSSGRYPFAQSLGRIESRKELASIYRRHDIYVMPSFKETFGVSYIEALSQGLPIVHSAGQGVDGFFDPDTVAEAVNPSSPADIAEKIRLLADRMDDIRALCRERAKRFDWRLIGNTYLDIYQEAILDHA